jgi:cell division FtsZ-interacting protein ZapD
MKKIKAYTMIPTLLMFALLALFSLYILNNIQQSEKLEQLAYNEAIARNMIKTHWNELKNSKKETINSWEFTSKIKEDVILVQVKNREKNFTTTFLFSTTQKVEQQK